jgi:hypothetical protein
MATQVNQATSEALRALADRVRSGTVSKALFNLLFGGIARSSGRPFADATATLNEFLGEDVALLSKLQ